ncbi:MAG: ABC transporter permease subunit, partial [Holophagales bacterium]|nr:ABC transporter permease subunit [Holophagales bacterium]
MSFETMSHIVRHEWRLLRREPAVGWAAGLLLAATVDALAGGIAWQSGRLAETAATAAESTEQIASQREAAAHGDAAAGRVGGIRVHAPFPPGPLAAFSVGLADLAPERAEISIWKRPDTLFGRYQLDSPLSLLAGRFDLGFVVLYLLPLFVLALSYNLLSAEREGGTLPLVMMQPVSLPQLVAAKLLARLVWITAFLLAVGAAGMIAAGLPVTALPRLAGWLTVAWLYGVFWLAVAALVASFSRSSETAAATLAAAWLTVVLVIPGLLEVGVQTASPVPSRLAFVSEMRAASSEAAKESAELLALYYHEHPELAANGQQDGFMPAFYASERQVERRLEPLLESFEASLASQQRLVSGWRFASPAVLAQEAFFDLAGSGLERQRLLDAAARRLLADWHAQLSPAIFLGRAL